VNSYKGNGLGSEWFLENVTIGLEGYGGLGRGKKRKEVRLPRGWQLPIYAV